MKQLLLSLTAMLFVSATTVVASTSTTKWKGVVTGLPAVCIIVNKDNNGTILSFREMDYIDVQEIDALNVQLEKLVHNGKRNEWKKYPDNHWSVTSSTSIRIEKDDGVTTSASIRITNSNNTISVYTCFE
jgi:hypothetical protein